MTNPDPPDDSKLWDVIIVGGGPAGLSAALVLGRCRRDVLLVDSNEPRKGASPAMHGYLTRDGMSPAEFRQVGRELYRPETMGDTFWHALDD